MMYRCDLQPRASMNLGNKKRRECVNAHKRSSNIPPPLNNPSFARSIDNTLLLVPTTKPGTPHCMHAKITTCPLNTSKKTKSRRVLWRELSSFAWVHLDIGLGFDTDVPMATPVVLETRSLSSHKPECACLGLPALGPTEGGRDEYGTHPTQQDEY